MIKTPPDEFKKHRSRYGHSQSADSSKGTKSAKLKRMRLVSMVMGPQLQF